MHRVDGSLAERLICCVAAGPLPAHHRRTRRKDVLVGSYAASMPRKVPRRWAGKDQSRWSVCTVGAVLGARCSTMVCRLNIQCRLGEAFSYAVTDYFSGAVSLPVAEPLAAWMDAAKAPAGMDSPRVPRAAKAPRPQPVSFACCVATALKMDTQKAPCGAFCVEAYWPISSSSTRPCRPCLLPSGRSPSGNRRSAIGGSAPCAAGNPTTPVASSCTRSRTSCGRRCPAR